ncbi:MAG: hypothetical protein IPI11_14790 [Haliscomenobacter sp.]|nr:hypothetical protein [Haliscomenobacter sp.]
MTQPIHNPQETSLRFSEHRVSNHLQASVHVSMHNYTDTNPNNDDYGRNNNYMTLSALHIAHDIKKAQQNL